MFSIFSPNLQVPQHLCGFWHSARAQGSHSVPACVGQGTLDPYKSLWMKELHPLHKGQLVSFIKDFMSRAHPHPSLLFHFLCMHHPKNSFPLAISAIVCGLRGWGKWGCRFLVLLFLIWRCLLSFPLTSSLYQMPWVNHRTCNVVSLVFL